MQMQSEEERRHREQERQRMEQAPQLQAPPGPPVHIHQPVAVGPRSVHGPNGLLGGTGMAGPQSQQQLGAPPGPPGVFSGGPNPPPPAPGVQHIQQGMHGQYGPGAQAQPPQPPQQPVGQVQPQQPILNDALSYLDQVKVQFANEPTVYNNFLDIMKDFKSGQIDTPGVISRVSSLFAGNPDLIQGFNTFLPPGYRIECGTGDDPNTIRVTTPMGTQNFTMPPVPVRGGQLAVEAHDRPANGTYTPQPAAQSNAMMFSPNGRPTAPGQAPGFMPIPEAGRATDAQASSSLHNALSTATGGPALRPGMSPRATPLPVQEPAGMVAAPSVEGIPAQTQAGAERRGPVEFNHAISYVNKIKVRYFPCGRGRSIPLKYHRVLVSRICTNNCNRRGLLHTQIFISNS